MERTTVLSLLGAAEGETGSRVTTADSCSRMSPPLFMGCLSSREEHAPNRLFLLPTENMNSEKNKFCFREVKNCGIPAIRDVEQFLFVTHL